MNNYFSYIDTSTRIIYFNIGIGLGSEYIEAYKNKLKLFDNHKKIKERIITENISQAVRNDTELNKLKVHEFHHYWQSFYYPFLFWLSNREYETLLGFACELNKCDKPVKIHQFGMDEGSLANLAYLHYTFRLTWDDATKQFSYQYDEIVTWGGDHFCLNDFIETATAVYQFAILGTGGYNEFWYWVRNPQNKAYSKLFCFLAKYIDKTILFDIVSICIELSFNTTEPVSAFCILLNNYSNYYQRGRNDNFQLAKILLESTFPTRDIELISYKNVTELPVTYINLTMYESFINQIQNYPLTIHAKKHIELIKKDQVDGLMLPQIRLTGDYKTCYSLYLYQISEISNKFLNDHFYPLGIVYNFLDIKGRDNCFVFSEEAVKNIHKSTNGEVCDSSEFLKEMIQVKDVLMSLYNTFNTKLPKYCHHSECKYFEIDLCRRWSSVPAKSEDCLFPSWFSYFFSKTIDIDKKELEPISKLKASGIQAEGDIIRNRIMQKKRFNFVVLNGLIILEISSEIIKENNTDYLLDFCYLQVNENGSFTDIIDNIVLDFPEYKDNNLEVFEIPEIRKWLNDTYNIYPYFFVFLNFSNKEFEQAKFILPCFIKYEISKQENIEYLIKLDEKSYLKFIEKTATNIYGFCNQHELDDETVEVFIKNLK